jgi:hypothetical protein
MTNLIRKESNSLLDYKIYGDMDSSTTWEISNNYDHISRGSRINNSFFGLSVN